MKDTIRKALEEENTDIDSVVEKISSAVYNEFIPVLDLFENRLREGSYLKIDKNTNRIIFLDKKNNVLASGKNFKAMLINFLWLETSDQFPNAEKMK